MDSTTDQTTDDTLEIPKNGLGKYWKTRIFSFVVLSGLVSGCGYLGREGYFAATDSWVAPAILGPDNDMIIDNKLKLSQLLLEKGRAQSEADAVDGDLEADAKAIARLDELKTFTGHALTFSTVSTSQQVQAGGADLKTLADQKATINQMLTRQALITDTAKKNLSAGLIAQPDYDKERQTLDQLQVALMENERTRMASNLLLSQAAMANHSLYTHDGQAPTQEMTMQAQMMVQIECETLQVEADQRTKFAEKERVKEELAKIDGLEVEMRARPIFKATEGNLHIAFVPYSQLHNLKIGDRVMDCVMGIIACKSVGAVKDIIAGEAIMPDVFGGGQSRGQFISLDVLNQDSMESKVLRVRHAD